MKQYEILANQARIFQPADYILVAYVVAKNKKEALRKYKDAIYAYPEPDDKDVDLQHNPGSSDTLIVRLVK